MGIRINKAIGYGVVDATEHGISISKATLEEHYALLSDPRALAQWALARVGDIRFDDPDPDFVLKMDIDIEDMRLAEGQRTGRCTSLLRGSLEFGDQPFFMLLPPSCRDWHRHDDIIDYMDAEQDGRSMRGYAEVLRGSSGVFPWSDRLVCFRPTPPHVASLLKNASGLVSGVSTLDDGLPTSMTGSARGVIIRMLRDGGLSDRHHAASLADHMLADWRPALPPLVAVLAHLLGLTDDQRNALRPMRVQFWR